MRAAGTAYSEQTDWSLEDLTPRRLDFAIDVLLDVSITLAILRISVRTDQGHGALGRSRNP